jgi:hypothetical protein
VRSGAEPIAAFSPPQSLDRNTGLAEAGDIAFDGASGHARPLSESSSRRRACAIETKLLDDRMLAFDERCRLMELDEARLTGTSNESSHNVIVIPT